MHLPICGLDDSIIWTLGSALCYTGDLSGEAFDSILLGGASDDDEEEEDDDGDANDDGDIFDELLCKAKLLTMRMTKNLRR